MALEKPAVRGLGIIVKSLVYSLVASLFALLPAILVENASMETRIVWSIFAVALGPVLFISSNLALGTTRLLPGALETLLLVFAAMQISSIIFLTMDDTGSQTGKFAQVLVEGVQPFYPWIDYFRESRQVNPLLRLKVEAISCAWYLGALILLFVCWIPSLFIFLRRNEDIEKLNPKHFGTIIKNLFYLNVMIVCIIVSMTGWLEFNFNTRRDRRCILFFDCYVQNDLAIIGAAALKAMTITVPPIIAILSIVSIGKRLRFR